MGETPEDRASAAATPWVQPALATSREEHDPPHNCAFGRDETEGGVGGSR